MSTKFDYLWRRIDLRYCPTRRRIFPESTLTLLSKQIEDQQMRQMARENNEEVSMPLEEEPNFDFDLRFNPDSFTPVESADAPEVIVNQNALVREISTYLGTRVLRELVQDITTLPGAGVVETNSLTRAFHRRGVNMRYLGKVARLLDAVDGVSVPLLKVCFMAP